MIVSQLCQIGEYAARMEYGKAMKQKLKAYWESSSLKFDDPVVAEVRKAGDEMAREANYDLHTLCERLREAERKHSERLVTAPPPIRQEQ